MNLYKATFASDFFWADVYATASSPAEAIRKFESDILNSSGWKDAACEERQMWIEELGEYPGDDAYEYAFDGQVTLVEEDATPIEGVEMRDAGSNG